MDIGSIFLIIAILLLVGLYIARPFLSKRKALVTRQEQQLSTLLADRDRTLDAINELDFDFRLGKIPEADYPSQRMILMTRGAEILQQLDVFQTNGKSRSKERALEKAIANRGPETQPRNAHRAVGSPDDELEALIADRRRDRKEITAGFCAQCGHAIQKSDRFCSKCGATIKLA